MTRFRMPVGNHSIGLDLCKRCQAVWFDGGELEALPKAVVPKDDLSPEAKQQMAILKIEQENEFNAELEDDTAKLQKWVHITDDVLRILLRFMLKI
jgi:Zn-finger nucleic acid-binding protein